MFWCMESEKKAMLMGWEMNDVQADKTKYSEDSY
jgi:hypothetical protein